MTEIGRVDVNITGKSDDTKSLFGDIAKTMSDFFTGVKNGMSTELERTFHGHKDHAEEYAKKVSGKGKTDIAGAFDFASTVLEGFGTGLRKALPWAVAEEIARKTTMAAIDSRTKAEDAMRTLEATGKVSTAQIATLREEWSKWAPNVGKDLNQLTVDYAHLINNSEALKDNFPLLEKYGKVTGTKWANVVSMADVATQGGTAPKDMPALLNIGAKAFIEHGDERAAAAAEVSTTFRGLKIDGALMQQQLVATIGALDPAMLGSDKAASALIKVINAVSHGGGESRLWNMMDKLREKKDLFWFLDEMVRLHDADSVMFQQEMQNDPSGRELILAWKEYRDKAQEYMSFADVDFTKSPILQDSTTSAINRLTQAFEELLKAIGDGLPVITALEFLAWRIEQDVELAKAASALAGAPVFGVPGWFAALANAVRLQMQSGNQTRRPSIPMPVPRPRAFADGGVADQDMNAQVGERGAESITSADGSSRTVDQATIARLSAGDVVTPLTTSGPNRDVDRQALYTNLVQKFARSKLVGQVPEGAEKFGITGGSPQEYARFGLADALAESEARGGTKPDPGDAARHLESIGLYQFDQGQAHKYGGGDAYDPEASSTAFETKALGPGTSWKGGSGKGINAMGDIFGSIRRPGEVGRRLGEASKYQGGAIPGMSQSAGGSLDFSSGDLDKPSAGAQTQQAFKTVTVKPKIEPIAPERHEVERAARSTVGMSNTRARRSHQSSHAGRLGYM